MFQANGSRSLSGGGKSDGGVVGNGERGSGDEFMVVDQVQASGCASELPPPQSRAVVRARGLDLCAFAARSQSFKYSGLVLDGRFANIISTNRMFIAP